MHVVDLLIQESHTLDVEQKHTVGDITHIIVELENVLVSLQIMIDCKHSDSNERYRETKQLQERIKHNET